MINRNEQEEWRRERNGITMRSPPVRSNTQIQERGTIFLKFFSLVPVPLQETVTILQAPPQNTRKVYVHLKTQTRGYNPPSRSSKAGRAKPALFSSATTPWLSCKITLKNQLHSSSVEDTVKILENGMVPISTYTSRNYRTFQSVNGYVERTTYEDG